MAFSRICVGAHVLSHGAEAIVTHIVHAEAVIVRMLGSGSVQQVQVRDLVFPLPERPSAETVDLTLIDDEKWNEAQRRYAVIQPLLLMGERIDTALLQRVAKESGNHPATLYRWLQRYRKENQQTALIAAKPGAVRGETRLPPEAEAILNAAVQERYLKPNRINVQQLHAEIARRCHAANVTCPHVNTVRSRVARLTQRTIVAERLGKRAAQEQCEPIHGHFPLQEKPLAVVQIDHTKLDVIVVGEADRKPLARPWLTLAIDVFSRMVVGFYVSLETPSAASTGMCLAQAILPKHDLLTRWDIQTGWPAWGKMGTIHCDNGKDFRGAMLRRACEQHGIELCFRPVRQPHYGGHIERLMGTVAGEIHTLPGTTFANPKERGEYDSAKQSALTLRELERWLARYIVEVYHQRPHSGLDGRPPVLVYEEGIATNGLPEVCTNAEQLRFNFLPFEERAVTVHGVVIDHIAYFSDVLRPLIQAKDKKGKPRKFVIRRDPRDISTVYLFDPDSKQYLEIPYRDRSHAPMSVWELREVRRRLREQGRNSTKEEVIFAAYEQMRRIEDSAVVKTKTMRRNAERRNARAPEAVAAAVPWAGDDALWTEELQPFPMSAMKETAR